MRRWANADRFTTEKWLCGDFIGNRVEHPF
jgi:hypothetical protein